MAVCASDIGGGAASRRERPASRRRSRRIALLGRDARRSDDVLADPLRRRGAGAGGARAGNCCSSMSSGRATSSTCIGAAGANSRRCKLVLVGASEGWTVADARSRRAGCAGDRRSAVNDLPASFEQLAATQSQYRADARRRGQGRDRHDRRNDTRYASQRAPICRQPGRACAASRARPASAGARRWR